MGTGASARPHNPVTSKKIYLQLDNKHEVIEVSTDCSTSDLKELLTSIAGLNKWANITLAKPDGSLVPITSSIPANTPQSRYKLNHVMESRGADGEMVSEVMDKVGEEFRRTFKIMEFQAEFSGRLEALERRFEAEGAKTVEIDKCKQELQKLQDQFLSNESARKNMALEQQVSKSREVPLYPKYVLTQETVEYLKKPTFNIWNWEPNEMLCLLEHMYHELGLVAELKINPIILRRWLVAIQENYRSNPFHNFRHCFCVTQMLYGMIHLCGLREIFTKLDLAVMITSAVCHDLDHPGFNNNYQVNARTELAIRYNDKSPLENHHCAVAFQILAKPETNIFGNVSSDVFQHIRTGIIELILATDMAKHAEIMKKYSECLSAGFDQNNEEHVQLLKIVMVKACDISNEVRPMEVSEPWVDCLLEEYFMQSDREKSEGLPVSSYMDRDTVTKPTAQIGFISFILLPMYQEIARQFPQIDKEMVQVLKTSLDHYQQLKLMEDMLKDVEQPEKKKSMDTAGPRPQNTGNNPDVIAVPLNTSKTSCSPKS